MWRRNWGGAERYDPKIIRVDVELSHETNRRQSKTCQRVQITLASRGPAIRAEASAENFYAALDAAVTKLEHRLRRSADRRHDRQHGRTPITAVAAAPEEMLGEEPLLTGAPVTSTAVLDGTPDAGVGAGFTDSRSNSSATADEEDDSRIVGGGRGRGAGPDRQDQGPPG